jgi:ubiquinone/menaquinone biosynthesis C-methylase UbiE
MAKPKIHSLKSGIQKAIGQTEESHTKNERENNPSKEPTYVQKYFSDERAELLKDIPAPIVKKAWLSLAHLLLDDGATVMDAGCNDGIMVYTMSVLNPRLNFIGVDIDDALITKAQNKYKRDNLRFVKANLFEAFAPENSADAIINSFVLHEIYSENLYNSRLVSRALHEQYRVLKEGGLIFIRDYVMPPLGEYVLLEIKDTHPSRSEALGDLSESDLLLWYSERARGKHHPDGAGFFIEELPPNYPNTKLFRLPAKWAHEFIARKDDRKKLAEEISKEYAFYTDLEFRKDLRAMGARVHYSAPHWDEGFVKSRIKNKVRLYNENGQSLGPPPTNYIIVAEKIGENKSQLLQERRNSKMGSGSVTLRTVKDDRTGEITDIACRNLDVAEILPYRISVDGRLKVYLHENVPRGLVNSVPRHGKNLDGRRWSGHMTEAMAVPASLPKNITAENHSALREFAAHYIGVKPSLDSSLQTGPGFYPDPYRIDEHILTYYYRVEQAHSRFPPLTALTDIQGFSTTGHIREFDAQDVMNAIAVGLIPASRLETQLLALFQLTGIRTEVWSDMPLHISEVPVEEVMKIERIAMHRAYKDTRFKDIKAKAGNIRLIQSVFVDEGRNQGGGMTGLAAKDMEFIVEEENTINTAVVMPLVKDLQGEVLAGIVTEYLPVPQRQNGTGFMVTLPSFPLPKDITDMDMAQRYIADKFMIEPKHVMRMGESYFTHIGLTPHRIYPFAVTSIRKKYRIGKYGTHIHFANIKDLWKMIYWDNHESFMRLVGMSYKSLCQDSALSVRWDFDIKLSDTASGTRIAHSSVALPVQTSTPLFSRDAILNGEETPITSTLSNQSPKPKN